MNRRQFVAAAGVAALGLLVYSSEYERRALVIEERTIALRGLADVFHGLRVAQISDVHNDEFTDPAYLKQVVATVNGLRPDLVVLTGDYISYKPFHTRQRLRFIDPCAAVLQTIACPLRYAIMGNHDAAVNAAAVTDSLVGHGIPVLANGYTAIERDGRRLWLGGVRDVTEDHPQLDTAVPRPGIRGSDPVILLSHEPDFADAAARHGGVDLVLSGHTHGGQVRLPFVGATVLPPLGKKYVEGLFQLGPMKLYVNRGIGTVGMPIRFRCRPEISLHTLVQS